MIPDEAVEAALAAQLSFKNQRGMDNSANLMRHILEAAAPHIMAGVVAELDNAERLCEMNGAGKDMAVVSVQQIRDAL